MEKVSITDLLSSLPEEQNKPIEKITQQLEDKNMKVKHISKKKQQQLLKKTNYQLAKQDLDKWVGIIKINRQKDHLDFSEKNKEQANVSYFKNAPLNQFEKKIQNKLKDIKMESAKTIMAQQQKLLEQVDPEQAKRRLAQARKHRTMVFNEQIKRRRIAKIKSKLYRKIKKRQRMKEQGKKLAHMSSEQKNQYIEKLTKNRIKQRITLRHNSKNKHIMNLLRFSKNQKNTVQKSVNEVNDIRRNQLGRINEEVLQNMSQQYDDDNYREQALKDLEKELQQLQQQGQQLQKNQKKGIEGMKFMKTGKEKALQAQHREGQKLLKALEGNQEIELSQEQQQMQQKKQQKIIQEKEQEFVSRKVYDSQLAKHKEASQRENPTNADNYKNLREYFLKQNQLQLLEGIDINKLKQKYQPNRIDMDLSDVIQKNKEIFDNFANHAVNENLKDFEQQKIGELQDNLTKGQPKKLKGWGSWAGPGIQEKKVDPKQELRKKLAKIQQIKKKRKDGSMSMVVINQSRNKNLSQFMVRKLPHEYKSVQQFDYLQDEALGPEWNTMTQFQQSIKPKINYQKGTTIQPIKLPKKVQLLSRGKKN